MVKATMKDYELIAARTLSTTTHTIFKKVLMCYSKICVETIEL